MTATTPSNRFIILSDSQVFSDVVVNGGTCCQNKSNRLPDCALRKRLEVLRVPLADVDDFARYLIEDSCFVLYIEFIRLPVFPYLMQIFHRVVDFR